jgi:hypothetical protein
VFIITFNIFSAIVWRRKVWTDVIHLWNPLPLVCFETFTLDLDMHKIHLISHIWFFAHKLSSGNQKFRKFQVQKRCTTLVKIAEKSPLSNLTYIFIKYTCMPHLASIWLFTKKLSPVNQHLIKHLVNKKFSQFKVQKW